MAEENYKVVEISDNTNGSTSTLNGDKAKKKAKKEEPMASIGETMSFIFQCGPGVQYLFVQGVIGSMLSGLVYPGLAYSFSSFFSDISTSAESANLDQIRRIAYILMGIGTYALVCGTAQGWSFELVGFHASRNLSLQWFKALLRQDQAYYDVNDIGGMSGQIGANTMRYRRGIGRKMGEGIQFFVTGVGGIGYAFYSSWKAALVILAVLPFCAFSASSVMVLNQTKTERAGKAYRRAGSVAYSSVSGIKTVLSLNAVKEMISQYADATEEAFTMASGTLVKQGMANGSMLGSFMLLYVCLTLYGTKLLADQVMETGCDPSASEFFGNPACAMSAVDLFGCMLGIAFAGQGVSQFGNFAEAFTAARVACHEALKSINRKPGAGAEIIYKSPEDDDIDRSTHSKGSRKIKKLEDETSTEPIVRAIIPKYEIDSTSPEGLKPGHIEGEISFNDVVFSYPTRPTEEVLKGVTVNIPKGTTAAFVGPSGSGKSTIVGLIERFYDPKSGSVKLDGNNLKDLNVKHLRSSIGYVGQEPVLFGTTIRGNIKYGNPSATDQEVEEAARLANAHDFITSFSDGYDTQVGDKGSQLSGGQKQRIAIARVLISKPSILLLDEATSALDSESELVVQDALDHILETKQITTIIIAHRLSTIRNADTINVLVSGKIMESGTHEELMAKESYYYNLVQKQEGGDDSSRSPTPSTSAADLTKLAEPQSIITPERPKLESLIPQIQFKDLSFAYPSRPKKIIFNNFNLTINRGETVALVGPSGGGKSTTVGLIERFYDPLSGVIEYAGTDIKSLNVNWYRDQIGYVGQEPTLFNDTISRNIAFGSPGITQEQIEHATKQANAHDFVMSFPDQYETLVGERGTQLSGGQKQRIAIARALVKKPSLLVLDEATSALDNESEAIVQAAIDQLIQSRNHTVIVIAHRLSTIRNADRIAVIADGKVVEQGSHDELVVKPDGRYRSLFESSKRDASAQRKRKSSAKGEEKDEAEEEEEEVEWSTLIEEEETKAFSSQRMREMISPETFYLLVGAVGSLLAGGVFPVWGLLFSEMIQLLFVVVEKCPNAEGEVPGGFGTCNDFFTSQAEDMQENSYRVAVYWGLLLVMVFAGNVMTFWGFGYASERMNKRVRDSAFTALLRQEVAFFDKRSVGSITSQLQDDASRLQAFSADPVRVFCTAFASLVTGLVVSFVYMWPFAILAVACVPFFSFAASLEMAQMLGTNDDLGNVAEGLATPGGILVETLLNVRTVAALTLEDQRFADYESALRNSEPNYISAAFISGVTFGFSQFLQQWINALQMWWGGWLLNQSWNSYSFNDFLISNFALLFSLFGLGAAFQDISDRKEVEKSGGRIIHLLDRKSAIDPLSEEGKKLDGVKHEEEIQFFSTKKTGVEEPEPVYDSDESSYL